MSDTRPVIIGMNNPHSTDSRADLMPHPSGVAGWRLWRLMADVSPISRGEFCRRTDRRNLLHARDWDPIAARRESEGLWETLQDRAVVVLGQATRNVLWLEDRPPLLWSVSRGVRWCLMPHPSGLNRWYNDSVCRAAAGHRLAQLVLCGPSEIGGCLECAGEV